MTFTALLVPWLSSYLDLRVVTELPDDLAVVSPLVRVNPIGGGSDPDLATFTSPRLVLDSFAAGYGPAERLAWDVHAAMRSLAGTTLGKATITRVETVSLPTWVPYADTDVRHFVDSFQLRVLTR